MRDVHGFFLFFMFYRIYRYLVSAVVLTFPMVTLSGCIFEYSECTEEKQTIVISNDWSDAPEATPEGMAYLFYREGLTQPWRFDFPGRDAGEVYLYEGQYRFVMYNDDTSAVLFETLPDGLPLATTAYSDIKIMGLEEELRKSPDMMWGGYMTSVVISANELRYKKADASDSVTVEYAPRMVLRTKPRQLTPRYTVIVLSIENWSGVEYSTGVMTGMASSIELFGEKPVGDPVAFSFGLKMGRDSVVTGSFVNFGLPDIGQEIANRNEVRLYFRLSDGREIRNAYDFTKEVRDAADPMNVVLVIDSIGLPKAPPVIKGGAFDPTVTTWKEIEVNYET